MNPSWTSFETIGGILAVMAFGALCYSNLRAGIIAFTAAGSIRNIQIGAFSGSEMVQGLLPVEALSAMLCVVWLLTRGRRGIRRTSFNTALLLLFPISLVSLLVGFVMYDPSIALRHMKLSVSLAQILLTMWPIATYLAIANSVHDTATINRVQKTIVLLALPSLVLVVAPGAWDYVSWSTSFALPASSICFAQFFETRSIPKRIGLLAIAFAPVAFGLQTNKAFYYAYVAVSSAVILWLTARRVLLAVLPLVVAAYVVAVPLTSGSLTPKWMTRLVAEETEQQSLGGTGGRETLIMDGLRIWSRAPIFGVGPGNNYPYMLRYSTLGTAHNQYVNILMELGVIGLACFAVFVWQALRMGFRLRRTLRQPLHRQLVVAWFGIFSAFLVGGFFGDFMLPSIRNAGLELFAEFYVQWIVLGLVVSAAAIERRHAAGGRAYVYA